MPDLTIENAPEETVKALEMLAEHMHTTVSAVALKYLPKRAPLSAEERAALRQSLSASWVRVSEPDLTPIKRDRDGMSENELSPEQALDLARSLRETAPREVYPDSVPGIRTDRDTR
jgi:hypothetical protein